MGKFRLTGLKNPLVKHAVMATVTRRNYCVHIVFSDFPPICDLFKLPLKRERHKMISDAIAALKTLLGDRLNQSTSDRNLHGQSESHFTTTPPDAVAYPTSTDEVRAIVEICHQHSCPMIVYCFTYTTSWIKTKIEDFKTAPPKLTRCIDCST